MREYKIKEIGYTMRYHDFPGDGIPILFIHGLGCAGSFDYPEVAAQKELEGHRKILVDLLGSGFSDKPEKFSYSVSAHAAYLYQFIKDIGLQQLIIFGHSLGGPVAIELATLCKDRVHRLILSESNLDPSQKGASSFEFGTCSKEHFVHKVFNRTVEMCRQKGQLWGASLGMCQPVAIHSISQCAVAGGRPSWREQLYALDCKKAFIFGEYSLPDSDENILKEHGIQIEVVENAGHSMAWENPKGLAKAIKNGIISK